MGYESSVYGKIQMTESAYEAVVEAIFIPHMTTSADIKLPPEKIAEHFESLIYEKGYLLIDDYGTHYELDAILRALSEIKDVDSIDAVKYSGEDEGDLIFYFIGKGFVAWYNPTNLMDAIFNSAVEHAEEFKNMLVASKLEGRSDSGDIALSDDDVIKLIMGL